MRRIEAQRMPNLEPRTSNPEPSNLEPGTVEPGTSLYCVAVSRTYIRVIVLETLIIIALVIFGRLFS